MDFGKNALGSFVRDMGRAVFSKPQRTEQPKPVQMVNKGLWKNNKAFITKKETLRALTKGGRNRKVLVGWDKTKIKLNTPEVEGQVDRIFGSKGRLLRKEALKRVQMIHKEAALDRQRGLKPSEIKKIREEEKFADKIIKPGVVEMGPKTPGIVDEVFHGFGNALKTIRGKEPTSLDREFLDASAINKQIGEIKQ